MKMEDVPGFDSAIDELSHDCEEGYRFFSVSLIVKHPDGQYSSTRPLPVRACCAGSATRLGWTRLGPAVCTTVNEELALKGVCIRGEGEITEGGQL